MVTYDSAIIMSFADALYKEAAVIVTKYTIGGIVVGAGLGYMGGGSNNFVIVGIGAAIVGAIGWSIGRSKAFSLKLQAQTALCQVRIEANTSSVAFAMAAVQKAG